MSAQRESREQRHNETTPRVSLPLNPGYSGYCGLNPEAFTIGPHFA
jgi:hypothetical protein